MTTAITLTSDITVHPVQQCGGDAMVVAAAKVSTTGEDALRFTDPSLADANAGLINYLMKERHGSPFEHSLLTFFVHAPAMVWWEWVRHRIAFSYSLESGRYKKLEPVFWIPRRERKMIPAVDHKAARPRYDLASDQVYQGVVESLTACYRVAWCGYETMLSIGVANEVARAVLGFGVYYSGWVSCNPRSLMAFLSLRTHEPAATFPSRPQAEIEEGARACEAVLVAGWPLTHAAFNKHGRVAP